MQEHNLPVVNVPSSRKSVKSACFSFLFPFKKKKKIVSQTLKYPSLTHSYSFLWVPLSSTLLELVLKSNMEQTMRRGLGKPTNSFFPFVCLLSHPITGKHLISKNKRFPPHPWFFNKKYSISFKSFIIQFWVILIVPISLLEK